MTNRVMIVGCPRSGTTILQTILASHPEVLGIFETHFYCVLCSSNKWARKLGLTPKQAAEILNDMQREYGYHQSQKIRLLSSKYASSLFVKTLDEAASNLGKKVWIEKTPQHLFYIDYIKRLTENIKFIHIERKPESVISSLYHASVVYPHIWPYDTKEKSFELWKESYLANQKYRGMKDHFFITLNELIKRPSEHLGRIWNFMKVEAIEGLENRQNEGFRTITEKGKEWLFESQKPLLKEERCRFKDVFDIEERKYLSERIRDTISRSNVI